MNDRPAQLSLEEVGLNKVKSEQMSILISFFRAEFLPNKVNVEDVIVLIMFISYKFSVPTEKLYRICK